MSINCGSPFLRWRIANILTSKVIGVLVCIGSKTFQYGAQEFLIISIGVHFLSLPIIASYLINVTVPF